MPRNCKNSPDLFCYVCAKFTPKPQRRVITPLFTNAYKKYFQQPMVNLDKPWTPTHCCSYCTRNLTGSIEENKKLPFNVPTIWREPRDHVSDCYFCFIEIGSHTRKSKSKIKYPTVSSVDQPMYREDFQRNLPTSRLDQSQETESATNTNRINDSEYEPNSESKTAKIPVLFDQEEVDDLVRDLHLSKRDAELLASRLKERNLVTPDVNITSFRNRDRHLHEFFLEESGLSYCSDIDGLMKSMGFDHESDEWRLFIDSSTNSLKAVLLHIGNSYPSLPVAYSTSHKENHENIQFLLEKIGYKHCQWRISADLKMVAIILGMQLGWTKFCCFLCQWDSRNRAQHYCQKVWPERENFTLGERNVIRLPLAQPEKICLPPLHIKLGLITSFVKSLKKDGSAFSYLKKLFPKLSEAKIKAGIFVGPQIKKLIQSNDEFKKHLSPIELQTWESIKEVLAKFLGSIRSTNYKIIVQQMLGNLKKMGVNMSLKIHFLDSHLDFFPESLVDVSDEHGE